jgi:serine protease Do
MRTIMAAAVAAALITGGAALALQLTGPASPVHAQRAPLGVARDLSQAFIKISEDASPAVVFIEVEKEMPQGMRRMMPFGDGAPHNPFEWFFGPDSPFGPRGPRGRSMPDDEDEQRRAPVPYGQGTGFIVSSDGYIVTNHHVVDEADRVRVNLKDGAQYDAEVVGTDEATEVALLKIDATGLPHLPVADSDELQVGEWVLAIGSPFGLTHSVSQGIVSARGRGNVNIGGLDYADFIQTDAAINPGNSGGPLLNLEGKVVGMNTAILSRSGGYMGIGFAIPSNMITYITDQLRETGTVERGFLGVLIQDLRPETAEWFGLEDTNGVLVTEVTPDSPADKAGLERDDIITTMDGQEVTAVGSFRSRVASTSPGTRIKLGVLRDGEEMTKTVLLGTLDEGQDGMRIRRRGGGEAEIESDMGFSVQDLNPTLASRLGFEEDEGVLVSAVEPGSAAQRAGLTQGVLIVEVNRESVSNTQEFKKALGDADPDKSLLLLVKDERGSRYVAIER